MPKTPQGDGNMPKTAKRLMRADSLAFMPKTPQGDGNMNANYN
jgi:hypothetical protein